jgi:hypothetical protein
MSGVWIDGLKYRGSSVVNLSLVSEVQKHPVEKGFAVADNIKHETPQFKVLLTLGGSLDGTDRDTEYSSLKSLRDNGVLFTFICDFGSFSDMVLSNISPAIEQSVNTFSCELTIVQIRQATLATKSFDVIDVDGTKIYSPAKPDGTPATQALQEKIVPDEPVKTSGSWLVSLSAWVGALL